MLKFRADASSTENLSSNNKWRKVVIAMDGSEPARQDDRIILVYAMEHHHAKLLANSEKEGNSKTDIDERTKLKEKLDSFQQLLSDFKLMGEIKPVSDKTPGKAILNAVEELNADVLVTGSRGHGTLKRAFLGSVSNYIVHHAHIPVIICRETSSEV
ncbi:universal stress protein in QAH/OAS sulfhydrylase 3'region-like isoform X2 [Argopecten irradians]|uniref:universal stress protein in QAH/OAS sulfhydrylase 3'region-like isoform X2 n=1 Tax=Argopecten irradians TaxID=31199 RepID=UPI003719A43B